jgi:hypothetical protein
MAEDDDSGLPEESQGKLDQISAVDTDNNGPWKIEGYSPFIVEKWEDLRKYANEIAISTTKPKRPTLRNTLVIVLDNQNKLTKFNDQPFYWMASYYGSIDDASWRPLVDWQSLEDFDRNTPEFNKKLKKKLEKTAGAIEVGEWKGIPVLVPNPTINWSRPEKQESTTTSTKTGNTVVTTTTVDPRAAGFVTESETILAEVGLDAFGGTGRDINNLNVGDRLTPAELLRAAGGGDTASATAIRTVEPCLPNNTGSGSGATPPASEPYPDAILRQARAAAAAPASVITDSLDTSGGADATAPTTVTQPPSTPTSSATATPRPPNVYIYEALTPGLDRYDFNTGKKVYTPDSGISRNTNSQPVVPQSVPRTPPGANLDPNRVGPQ